MKKIIFITSILFVVIFTASISANQKNNFELNQTRTIEITISGLAFSPSTITVDEGETVTFQVTNNDGFAHTFTIDSENRLALGGGETKDLSWTAPNSPTLVGWHCEIHTSMTGTITVGNVTSSSSSSTDTSTSSEIDTSSTSTDNETSLSTSQSTSSEAPVVSFLIIFLLGNLVRWRVTKKN